MRCEWAGGVSGGGGRQEDRWVDTVCGALEGLCDPGTVKRAPGEGSLCVPTGGCGGSQWRPPAEAAYGGSSWRQPVEATCRGSLWRQPAEAAWGGQSGETACVCVCVCVRSEWAGGVTGGGGRQEDRRVATVGGALEGHRGPGTVKRAPGGSSLYVPAAGGGGSPWRPPEEATCGSSPWRQPVEAACRGRLCRQPAEAAWGGQSVETGRGGRRRGRPKTVQA